MVYTVRYAHLEYSMIDVGDEVRAPALIGRMGNTGASSGAHLHIDCVEGSVRRSWLLSDAENYNVRPAYRQLIYFIDQDLFKHPLKITTRFCDISYFFEYNKIHTAYDVIPSDGDRTDDHFDIFWNRSMPGKVIAKGDHAGYGNYLHIQFDI